MCLEKLCGKMCGMHKNPVNCLLHLIAGIIIVYGLWQHSIKLILIGILIALAGHVIQAITLKKGVKKKKRK